MDNAKAFYEEESDDGVFKLEACWKVLRDQKWHAYNEDLNGSHKRKYSETEAIDLIASANPVTDLLLEPVVTTEFTILELACSRSSSLP
jgi:hypothetical protein